MSELVYLIPEFFLLFAVILVLFSKNKEIFAFLGLLITAYLVLEYQHHLDSSAFNGLLFFGKITQIMKLFSLVMAAFIALIFYADRGFIKKQNVNSSKLYVVGEDQSVTMMMFSMLGMLFVISSNNFISLYVSLELQSLPMYVLVASNRNSIHSSEAGIKYFVLGSLASCIMVYGISILYVSTGNLSFVDLGDLFQMKNNFPVVISMLLVISALLFKLSAVPFHLWLPDVYSGSPKKIAVFLAVVPKISVIVLLCRFFSTNLIYGFPLVSDISWGFNSDIANTQHLFRGFLLIVGSLSVFLGAVAAVMQNNIRRLFAYSTINHIGYIIIGIAVNKCSYATECLGSAPILYTVFYSVLNIGIFSCILLLKHENISELSGFAKGRVLLPLCFSILLLSSAGIPPFAGFMAKFYLISEVIKSGLNVYAFFILLSTGFAVYYYIKIIKTMYFDTSNSDVQVEDSNLLIIFVIVVSMINLLFFLGFILYSKFF